MELIFLSYLIYLVAFGVITLITCFFTQIQYGIKNSIFWESILIPYVTWFLMPNFIVKSLVNLVLEMLCLGLIAGFINMTFNLTKQKNKVLFNIALILSTVVIFFIFPTMPE